MTDNGCKGFEEKLTKNQRQAVVFHLPLAILILYWAYWLSFVAVLPDSKATYCCFWHIFLIFPRFLEAFGSLLV